MGLGNFVPPLKFVLILFTFHLRPPATALSRKRLSPLVSRSSGGEALERNSAFSNLQRRRASPGGEPNPLMDFGEREGGFNLVLSDFSF